MRKEFSSLIAAHTCFVSLHGVCMLNYTKLCFYIKTNRSYRYRHQRKSHAKRLKRGQIIIFTDIEEQSRCPRSFFTIRKLIVDANRGQIENCGWAKGRHYHLSVGYIHIRAMNVPLNHCSAVFTNKWFRYSSGFRRLPNIVNRQRHLFYTVNIHFTVSCVYNCIYCYSLNHV